MSNESSNTFAAKFSYQQRIFVLNRGKRQFDQTIADINT